jgi:hypothetical protein
MIIVGLLLLIMPWLCVCDGGGGETLTRPPDHVAS